MIRGALFALDPTPAQLQAARKAQQTIEELQTGLQVAQDELAAARTSLRRVIKSENRRAAT